MRAPSITAPQQAALRSLAPILDPSAYLGGGVAFALRLHHRTSRDLDLFVPRDDLVPDPLALPPDSRLMSRAPGTLYVEVGGVPTSIIRYAYPLLATVERIEGSAVPVASLDDLVAMKLSAIASRGARRDLWDLHDALVARQQPLADALDAFARKFQSEDLGHVVRSLVYFADAEREPRPDGLTEERWAKIRLDLERWVRAL